MLTCVGGLNVFKTYIPTPFMKYVMILMHAFIVCIKMSKNNNLPTSATSEVNEIIWSVTGMNMNARDPRVNKSFQNMSVCVRQ